MCMHNIIIYYMAIDDSPYKTMIPRYNVIEYEIRTMRWSIVGLRDRPAYIYNKIILNKHSFIVDKIHVPTEWTDCCKYYLLCRQSINGVVYYRFPLQAIQKIYCEFEIIRHDVTHCWYT